MPRLEIDGFDAIGNLSCLLVIAGAIEFRPDCFTTPGLGCLAVTAHYATASLAVIDLAGIVAAEITK